MKKLFLALALMCGVGAQAQIEGDNNLFNHFSVGVGVGTTGIGVEVGTTVCPYVTLRGGVDFLPGVSFSTSAEFQEPGGWYNLPVATRHRYMPNDDFETNLDLKLNMMSGKILFDLYPSKNSKFHLTVGAYISHKNFLDLDTKASILNGVRQFNEDVKDNNKEVYGLDKILFEGYELGIEEDRSKLAIKTKSFRPYVGIGIGRTTPRKRLGLKFEMGAQFWGTPKLHDGVKGENIDKDTEGISEDLSDALSIAGKVCAYPTLKLTLFGRIF